MMLNEFHQKCESISVKLRHELGLRGYDPLPPHQLAKHLTIKIVCPHELPGIDAETVSRAIQSNGWHAIAVLTEPRIIIYHPERTIAQQSFSIMHELAHIVLKHKPEQLGKISDLYITRKYPKQQEFEADYLAACLQFPKVARQYARQKKMSTIEIHEYYGISEEVIAIRFGSQ